MRFFFFVFFSKGFFFLSFFPFGSIEVSAALDRNLSLGEIEIERFLSEFSIVRNLHLFDLIPELEGFRLFKFCEWEEFLYVALGFRSRGCECRISSISEF